jgi:hypothetical protein
MYRLWHALHVYVCVHACVCGSCKPGVYTHVSSALYVFTCVLCEPMCMCGSCVHVYSTFCLDVVCMCTSGHTHVCAGSASCTSPYMHPWVKVCTCMVCVCVCVECACVFIHTCVWVWACVHVLSVGSVHYSDIAARRLSCTLGAVRLVGR